MDNERALFGLCGNQFGPKPFCFCTGCYPSVPLAATSHTSHNPIHGDKYVQSCSSEWLLICQIGLFYCERNCLVSRMGTDPHCWPPERNGTSVKTTHPLSEGHRDTFILSPLNQTTCSLLMVSINLAMNQSICKMLLWWMQQHIPQTTNSQRLCSCS